MPLRNPRRKREPPTRPKADDDEDFDFTPAEIAALGLNNLKRIVGRFGFQGEAFLTDLRMDAPSPRKGINACFDQPMFRKGPTAPHTARSGYLRRRLARHRQYTIRVSLE